MYLKKTIMMMFIMLSMMSSTSEMYLNLWMMMEMMTIMLLILALMDKTIKILPLILPIQVTSSSMILASISINSTFSNYSEWFMSIGLMMKMGMFPLDSWIYLTLKHMKWNLIMMMLTINKIPLFMMMKMNEFNMLMSFSLLLSPIMSAIKSMKLNSTKMILAPSSIIHSSWMILCMMVSKKTWSLYFLVYAITMMMMMNMLKYMYPEMSNTNMPQQMNKTKKFSMMSMMMMMMGMPPSVTFMLKITAMNQMMMSKMWIMIPSLVISSSVSILFYSRMILTISMSSYESSKIKIKNTYNNAIPSSIPIMLTSIMMTMS